MISGLDGASALFIAGGPAIDIDDASAVTVMETNIALGGTLTATITDDQAGEDVLGVRSAGDVAVSAGVVTDRGSAIGTIGTIANGTGGAPLSVILFTGDTTTQVSDLIDALTYSDTGSTPVATPRSIGVTLTDAAGNTSAVSTVTVTVGVAVPPAIAGILAADDTGTSDTDGITSDAQPDHPGHGAARRGAHHPRQRQHPRHDHRRRHRHLAVHPGHCAGRRRLRRDGHRRGRQQLGRRPHAHHRHGGTGGNHSRPRPTAPA